MALLRSFGLDAHAYGSAEAFLTNDCQPNCVISDVQMPGKDGFQLLSEIKSRSSAIPVVLMTAHSISEARARAFERGANCFLEKPLDDDALIACLSGVLDRDARVS